jgi:hypothetical protein
MMECSITSFPEVKIANVGEKLKSLTLHSRGTGYASPQFNVSRYPFFPFFIDAQSATILP